MLRKLNNFLLLLSLLAMGLSSCSSKKNLQEDTRNLEAKVETLADKPSLAPVELSSRCLSANVELTVTLGQEKLHVKGKFKMKNGEGVQVSVTPMGIMEAACIEFLPENINVIYKLKQIATKVLYADAGYIGLSGINYDVLESIFQNAVFLPDGRSAHYSPGAITVESMGDYYRLATGSNGSMKYSFHIDKDSNNLVYTEGVGHTGATIQCSYSGFEDIGGRQFPTKIELLYKAAEPLGLTIEFTKFNNDDFSFAPRKLGSSYTELDFEDFISSF